MQLRLRNIFLIGISLLVLSSSTYAEENVKLSPSLKKFLVQSYQYTLNAPWLVEEFSNMNFNEFSAAWTYIVCIMKNPKERWRFFCDSKEEYVEKNYSANWIWQCHFFELWLSKVFVCIDDFSIVYDCKDIYKSNSKYIHIYACWQTLIENGQGDYSAIYDFFAFYADCLARCLLEGITIANFEIDSPLFDGAWQKSYSIAEGLKIMISMLQKSDYAQRYAAQLERYNQILELLKQERLMQFFAQ